MEGVTGLWVVLGAAVLLAALGWSGTPAGQRVRPAEVGPRDMIGWVRAGLVRLVTLDARRRPPSW